MVPVLAFTGIFSPLFNGRILLFVFVLIGSILLPFKYFFCIQLVNGVFCIKCENFTVNFGIQLKYFLRGFNMSILLLFLIQ